MHAALGQQAANVRGVVESVRHWAGVFSARPFQLVEIGPALSAEAQLPSVPRAGVSRAPVPNLAGPAASILRAHADRLHPFRGPVGPGVVSARAVLLPWTRQATRGLHSSSCPAPSALRRPVIPLRNHARQISLSSVKNLWQSSTATLSPVQIWRIDRLESQADLAPNDPNAQRALFQALVEADIKVAYERLIRRWERILEFSPQNSVLRDDEAFRLYVVALVKTGQSASVDSATRRRDTVLAKPQPDAPQTPSTEPSRSSVIAQSVVDDPNAHARLNTPTPVTATSPLAADAPLAGTSATATTSSPTSSPGILAMLAAAGPGGKDAPIYVTIAQPKGEAMWRFLRFLALLAVGGFVVFTGIAVFAENTGILKGKNEPSEYQVTADKAVTFVDVHGVDEAKEELQEIVQFLKDPTVFSTLGGKLSKGVLLTGPPGTGKTLLARAVAGEAGVPFFFASGSEFDEMFVGVGAKRMRNLFKAAREKGPAIIFIDELDAVGTKRSARDQQHMKQTLNQLLVEMDGFSPSDGVIVIAATNFPQTLDSALVRPGRFDKKITVPLPDVRGREQILKHHLRNTKLDQNIDVNKLARGTSGFSGADLENLCNQAAVRAARDKFQFVALKHLEWARDRIIMGAERRSMFMDDKVKLLTAYHEGGHALVAMFTDGSLPVFKVTCMPRGQSLGHTSFLPDSDMHSVSLKEYRARLDVAMGGRLAEEIVYGHEQVTSGCSSDLQAATSTARAMVRYFGMSDEVGPVFYDLQDATISAAEKQVIDREVKNLLTAASDRARSLLQSKREELRLLAEALIEHETLDLDEVKKVIRGEKIREGEKHNVSNVEITIVTSPPPLLPTPPPEAVPPTMASTPASATQSRHEDQVEDPPFISA